MGFYFVYVLLSLKDRQFYIGFTRDLQRRIKEHQRGETESTSKRLPVQLIYFEGFMNKKGALRREGYFKTTKGKTVLRMMLTEYLLEIKKES